MEEIKWRSQEQEETTAKVYYNLFKTFKCEKNRSHETLHIQLNTLKISFELLLLILNSEFGFGYPRHISDLLYR